MRGAWRGPRRGSGSASLSAAGGSELEPRCARRIAEGEWDSGRGVHAWTGSVIPPRPAPPTVARAGCADASWPALRAGCRPRRRGPRRAAASACWPTRCSPGADGPVVAALRGRVAGAGRGPCASGSRCSSATRSCCSSCFWSARADASCAPRPAVTRPAARAASPTRRRWSGCATTARSATERHARGAAAAGGRPARQGGPGPRGGADGGHRARGAERPRHHRRATRGCWSSADPPESRGSARGIREECETLEAVIRRFMDFVKRETLDLGAVSTSPACWRAWSRGSRAAPGARGRAWTRRRRGRWPTRSCWSAPSRTSSATRREAAGSRGPRLGDGGRARARR